MTGDPLGLAVLGAVFGAMALAMWASEGRGRRR